MPAGQRVVATRMVGLPGDLSYRTDSDGYTVKRQFTGFPRDLAEIHAEPCFEGQCTRSMCSRTCHDLNPSVVSCVFDSQFCATTEEHALPIMHGNDRVEWFIQATGDIDDGKTGAPRAKGDDEGRRCGGHASKTFFRSTDWKVSRDGDWLCDTHR
jgi:hypothetical protein